MPALPSRRVLKKSLNPKPGAPVKILVRERNIFHGEAPKKYTQGATGCVQGQGYHQDQGLSDQAGEGGCYDKDEPGASTKLQN